MASRSSIVLVNAALGLLSLAGCEDAGGATGRGSPVPSYGDYPTVDTYGNCAASPTPGAALPIGPDGVVYADEGANTYLPAGSHGASVLSVVAIAVSGETLFMERVFRNHSVLDGAYGGAQLVGVATNQRSERCAVSQRWLPLSRIEAPERDHLVIEGQELMFFGDNGGPSALPITGTAAVALASASTGSHLKVALLQQVELVDSLVFHLLVADVPPNDRFVSSHG